MKWLCLAFVLLPVAAGAQTTATPTQKLAWDQTAPDLAAAQSYEYRVYLDGGTTGTLLTGVTCTATSGVFACEAPFPAVTPGPHTATVTAKNAAGESTPSGALSFTFVAIPTPPTNLRIK